MAKKKPALRMMLIDLMFGEDEQAPVPPSALVDALGRALYDVAGAAIENTLEPYGHELENAPQEERAMVREYEKIRRSAQKISGMAEKFVDLDYFVGED